MKNNVKTIVICIGLTLVLFIGLLAVEKYMLSQYERADAVVAIKDVPAGTDITKKNVKEFFSIKRIMKSMITQTTITTMEELYESYPKQELKSGSLIYKEAICTAEDEIEGVMNPTEISLSLNSFTDAVSGTLRKGDYVYIYWIDRNSGDTIMFGTKPVYIKESFNASGEPVPVTDKTSAASVFTFVIDSSMSQEFCSKMKTYDVVLVLPQNVKTDMGNVFEKEVTEEAVGVLDEIVSDETVVVDK